jgi:hypothetical protein
MSHDATSPSERKSYSAETQNAADAAAFCLFPPLIFGTGRIDLPFQFQAERELPG